MNVELRVHSLSWRNRIVAWLITPALLWFWVLAKTLGPTISVNWEYPPSTQ